MTTILIISIDQNPNLSLRQTLETNGFLTDIQPFVQDKTPAAIQQRNPDLILLDLFKTNGNATEICQAVRRSNAAPLLVLSTSDSPEEVAKILDAGADDYLVKPVSNQMLLASISKFTRRSPDNKNNLARIHPFNLK